MAPHYSLELTRGDVEGHRAACSHSLATRPRHWGFMLSMIPTALRMQAEESRLKAEGKVPVLDVFDHSADAQLGGMPCGGLGAPVVSRSVEGRFNRWHLGGLRAQHADSPLCGFRL